MKLEEFKPLEQYKAINWNEVSDMIDKATWEKLTEQFWLDTRIPVSNDMDDWRELDDDHRWTVGHVLVAWLCWIPSNQKRGSRH